MRVFTCADRWEDMASCIYDAWAWALTGGHDRLRLEKEPVLQATLFDEYVHIEPDPAKAEKVMRSVWHKISPEAYHLISYASLYREDMLDEIYRFLRLGFSAGGRATSMLTDPHVMRLMEASRNVTNEIHYFREFARFDQMADGVLISHIEPKNQVVYPVSEHFADRMPSLPWMIVDDRRALAVVHPADEPSYLRELTGEEAALLAQSEEQSDTYSELWQTFFSATAIPQRENPACQRTHFPLWMRRHATEFRQPPGA